MREETRSTPVNWDREWELAWKAHPENPWFQYQADVYADWIQRQPVGATAWVLKTDAFDEACGFRPLDRFLTDTASVVLMDISRCIIEQAMGRRGSAALPCVADVRMRVFRPRSCDLIVSLSTLDHFNDARDIEIALTQLHAVLQPGGRLVVTLDNPANPVLCLRHLVHQCTGHLGGLIPFAMGRTLSCKQLVTVVQRVGLHVEKSGYLLHAPRVLGLWVGEWAARRGHHDLARRLRVCCGWIERVMRWLPTRPWTGHFVVVDCRRPHPPSTASPRRGGGSLPTLLFQADGVSR